MSSPSTGGEAEAQSGQGHPANTWWSRSSVWLPATLSHHNASGIRGSPLLPDPRPVREAVRSAADLRPRTMWALPCAGHLCLLSHVRGSPRASLQPALREAAGKGGARWQTLVESRRHEWGPATARNEGPRREGPLGSFMEGPLQHAGRIRGITMGSLDGAHKNRDDPINLNFV